MDKYKIGIQLMNCFPNSFINYQGEFIAHKYANEYFILDSCETETDVKYKVLSWFSRGACISEPYRTKKKNKEFHEFMLNGINKFLGTNFSQRDIEIIYTYFGNGLNREGCYEFINSNYDMTIVENVVEWRIVK